MKESIDLLNMSFRYHRRLPDSRQIESEDEFQEIAKIHLRALENVAASLEDIYIEDVQILRNTLEVVKHLLNPAQKGYRNLFFSSLNTLYMVERSLRKKGAAVLVS
jgi:hypothetical protein